MSASLGLLLAGLVPGCSTVQDEPAPALQSQKDPLVLTRGSKISGRRYEHLTMAAVGADGMTDLYTGPSIDDKGRVAFTGAAGSQSVFIADGVSAPIRLHNSSTSRNFTDGPQLGGNLKVAASDRYLTSTYYYRLWDGTQPGNYQLVAQSGTFNGSTLNSIAGFPALSADGTRSAFVGLRGSTYALITGTSAPYGELSMGTTAVRPMVANDGSVLYARQGTSGPLIVLTDYTLNTSTRIADNTYFSALGLRPGISDDGQVVVFYGVLTATGAAAFGTHAGPGIFASIPPTTGTTRRILRIAGRKVQKDYTALNFDGVCDPYETCDDGELGFDEAGNPRTFASFLDTSRVAVIRQEFGRPGLVDDTLTVTFMATPSGPLNDGLYTQSLGIWSVRVDLYDQLTGRIEDVTQTGIPENNDVLEKPFQPRPVVQVGDTLGNRTITALSVLNDPLAPVSINPDGTARLSRRGDHWLAYHATTNAGLIIVRATATDTDGDTLPDHWERSGIDFNQDGVIDLDLHNPQTFKADVFTRDVYLEIDYMRVPGGHDHRPDQTRLKQLVNEFANNNVALHLFVDDKDQLPELTPLQFDSRSNTHHPPAGRFSQIKLGGNPMVLCGTGAGVGAFGDTDIRTAANCDLLQRARLLVFRYMLIGHKLSHPAFPEGYGGLSELGGDDSFIALGHLGDTAQQSFFKDSVGNARQSCRASEQNDLRLCGYRTALTDIIMHELGHTLGLRHGGDEDYNCKPNYRSVMSYSLTYRHYDGHRARSYSGSRLDDLNELSLDENVGIGAVGNGAIVFGDNSGQTHVVPWTVAVNWDLTGTATNTNASNNINRIDDVRCSGDGFVLRGFDDWSNLFRQPFGHYRSLAQWANGSAPFEELLPSDVVLAVQGLDSDEDGINNDTDNCPFVANVTQTDADSDGIGDDCEPLLAAPDMAVTATATPEPVTLGDLLTVDVTVSNEGSAASTGVLLEYVLPVGVSVEAVTTTKGTCAPKGLRYECKLGEVAAAEDVSLLFQMRPQQSGVLEHAFSVSSAGFDVNEANDTALVTGTVN